MKEASDLNDGDIMGRTTFEQSPQGHRKFKFVLPTGQEITSEWIREDAIPQAGRAWPDAVRAQIVAHAQEAVEETRRKMQLLGIDTPDKRRAKGISPPREGDIDSTGLPDRAVAGAIIIGGPVAPARAPSPAAVASDPFMFATSELGKAEATLERLHGEIEELERQRGVAIAARNKWNAVVTALQGVQ